MTGHRQCAAHGSQRTIETELADEHSLLERLRCQLAGRHENADRNRQIERSSFLADICGRQIDRDPPRWHQKAGIDESRADALATLFDGARSEADDRPLWQALCGVNLDDYVESVDADERGRTYSCKHLL